MTLSSKSLRAALIAAAAFGATSLAATAPAQAHHRHGLGLSISFGDGYGYSRIYAGRRCGWLRREAAMTGSPYLWDRYYDCRAGY